VGKCPKDKIRAHLYSPSSFDRPYAHLQTAKNCLARRRSIFFCLLDANALLREQFFRLEFIVVQPELLKSFPSASKTGASGGISLARNPYAEALFKGVAAVSGCACPTTSMSRCCDLCTKIVLFFGCSIHFTEVEKPQEGAR
jgi:hypothetical protein